MNVLSIYYKHKMGGFNKRLYMLYQAIVKDNHKIFYIASESLPLKEKNIIPCVVNVPCSKLENIVFWLCFIIISCVKSLIVGSKNNIKSIVSFGPFNTTLAIIIIVGKKINAITFIRADKMKHSGYRIRNCFFYITEWIGLKYSSKIITVSESLKETYKRRYKIPKEKIYVLPNNIEKIYRIERTQREKIRNQFGLSNDDFLVSTVGTFTEGKNFGYLIRAMGKLSDRGIKLIIIGDEVVPNGEKSRLQKLSKQFGLQDRIIFCGWQNDPLSFIASSDLFVYPSKHEGSPNALLEALGCGVPCLGSQIDEIREILNYDDLLFPLGCEEILVQKIKHAKNDEIFYSKIQTLCELRTKQFSFDWRKEALKLVVGK